MVGEEVTESDNVYLHQYDVATTSCVRVIPQPIIYGSFATSPCSRVVPGGSTGDASHTLLQRVAVCGHLPCVDKRLQSAKNPPKLW